MTLAAPPRNSQSRLPSKSGWVVVAGLLRLGYRDWWNERSSRAGLPYLDPQMHG